MFKSVFLTIFALIITSCSADYEKLSKGNFSSDSSFYNTLIKEYKKKADFEAKEMHDWNSAKLYSIKALKSHKGENIKPEPINSWKIENIDLEQLHKSYDNLISIYETAIINDPINLAKAIVALDCWAEQQEEGWQLDHIKECRSNFLDAMHLIYNSISENVKVNDDKNDSVLIVTKKNNIIDKVIYFDFNSFKISPENKEEIKEYILSNAFEKYIIVGHTDTKGTKNYNVELSKRRAESVKNILLDYGIKSKKIKILAMGEKNLAVATPDETPHPANRRAVISSSY
tara:strand:- start:80 stop:940 length:861 start_codon:yes stop_codon:yes gene_type:complete